jgi:DNA-binding response OmpR family regulator
VETAADGTEALDKIEREDYQLVLLTRSSPTRRAELLKTIKARKRGIRS